MIKVLHHYSLQFIVYTSCGSEILLDESEKLYIEYMKRRRAEDYKEMDRLFNL